MRRELKRSVLVTGGNRGIGLAIAQAFAAQGDRVAVLQRSTEPVPGLLSVPCDLTSGEQIDAAVTAVENGQGAVEILVANAGVADDCPLGLMTEDRFGKVVDTNLTSAYRLSRRVYRPMLRARWGRLVFISSIAAATGARGSANYAASKAGLTGFARSLAREFGPYGITANTVSPGAIATGMFHELDPGRRDELVRGTFLGRPGEPGEVAAAVLWLCGDEGGYVTGADIPVDGGLSLGG